MFAFAECRSDNKEEIAIDDWEDLFGETSDEPEATGEGLGFERSAPCFARLA